MRDSYHCDYVLLSFVVKKGQRHEGRQVMGWEKEEMGVGGGHTWRPAPLLRSSTQTIALWLYLWCADIYTHTHAHKLTCTYTATHTLTHTSNKVFAVVAFNTNTLYLVPAARCCCCCYLLLLLLVVIVAPSVVALAIFSLRCLWLWIFAFVCELNEMANEKFNSQ